MWECLRFQFIYSITMIHTRRWRSRRRLRRTYSTKHTGRTVRCVPHIRDSLFSSLSTCLITYMVSFCLCLGEIALLEGLTVVYKSNIDLFFYVIGSSHENEVSLKLVLGFCNKLLLNKSYNPTIEERAKSHKHKFTKIVSDPILSLTAEVMVLIIGDQTVLFKNW